MNENVKIFILVYIFINHYRYEENSLIIIIQNFKNIFLSFSIFRILFLNQIKRNMKQFICICSNCAKAFLLNSEEKFLREVETNFSQSNLFNSAIPLPEFKKYFLPLPLCPDCLETQKILYEKIIALMGSFTEFSQNQKVNNNLIIEQPLIKQQKPSSIQDSSSIYVSDSHHGRKVHHSRPVRKIGHNLMIFTSFRIRIENPYATINHQRLGCLDLQQYFVGEAEIKAGLHYICRFFNTIRRIVSSAYGKSISNDIFSNELLSSKDISTYFVILIKVGQTKNLFQLLSEEDIENIKSIDVSFSKNQNGLVKLTFEMRRFLFFLKKVQMSLIYDC